ncbi:MAG: GNAT family N-acetyltransferase, partial [Planctomicrobium sp.]|nr:GNAT family N-acetyltransferase [Planctomicrobium sp.]
LLEQCSASRRKTLRKGWKKLSQAGDVEFRLRRLPNEIPSAIDSFLELEALGWKGEQGTALSCKSSHAVFFSKMCEEFSKAGRVIFGEILLNNQVIASTCNLLSGNTLFAFKIGWDHNYSNCSLGYWSEVLLADAIHHEAKEVCLIDSCSDEDSYTGKVWQDRIEIGSTILIWSRRAKLMREAKKVVKKLVKN